MKRSIEFNSVGNARELGGIRIGDKTIKKGALIRTASLAGISSEEKTILEEKYQVAYVVDLRMSLEKNVSPDVALSGAENIFLPVMEGEDYDGFTEDVARELADPNRDRIGMMIKSKEMGMLDENLYSQFLLSDRGKNAYRKLFQLLLEMPEGRSILWHCTDGKDRTGVASMLILAALGADEETILEDYLLTNEYNAKKIAGAKVAIDSLDLDPELKRLAVFGSGAVYEEFMQNAIDALVKNYGSVENYLSDEMGLGEAERQILQEKFLETEM
ncbi:MAG: tyrosine-protein phosphatase [Eubacterium sp.]|nr:tyrosine-protein phosphatase [Eubacterium sp.]